MNNDDPLRYALEINPWTPPDDLRQATLWRGVIIGAWGSVETTLKEIASRASKTPPYNSIECRIPTNRKDLIAYLSLVLNRSGLIQSLAPEIQLLISGYENGAEDRNLLAHAHMTVLGNWGATFSAFHPKRDKDGDYFFYAEIRKTMMELDQMARSATDLSHKAQAVRGRIDETCLLKPIN